MLDSQYNELISLLQKVLDRYNGIVCIAFVSCLALLVVVVVLLCWYNDKCVDTKRINDERRTKELIELSKK